MNGTILVADDESLITELISLYLEKDNFQVLVANNGPSIIELTHFHNPDLIIMDVVMPGMDGLEVCKELRKHTSVPIIFLSCRGENTDKIVGLEVGADDYMTKPFDPNELVARVKANLRRSRMAADPPVDRESNLLQYGQLEIDLSGHDVRVGGVPVALTPKEFQLLALLARKPNRVYSFEQLFTRIWNSSVISDVRTVMVHIRKLRTKIEPNPSQPVYILTVRGTGYKFNGFVK